MDIKLFSSVTWRRYKHNCQQEDSIGKLQKPRASYPSGLEMKIQMKTPRGNSTKRNFSLEMKELENFQLYTNCINEFYCNLIEWNFVTLSLRKSAGVLL